MTFNRGDIAAEAQEYYSKLGQRYGSDDALRQADKTLAAVLKYGPLLAEHGFAGSQAALLTDLREAQLGAGVTRDQSKTGKKVTNAAHLDAIGDAKSLRFKLRSIFDNARTPLFNGGDKASVNEIDAALASTSSAGDDSELLGRQLQTLIDLAKKTAIRQQVGGGDEAAAAALETEVTEQIATLNSTRAQSAGPRGTPADTEYLNLLDGMIAVLCRNARKAARALSRATGQPAIAKEFELSELYRTSRRGRNEGEGSPTPA